MVYGNGLEVPLLLHPLHFNKTGALRVKHLIAKSSHTSQKVDAFIAARCQVYAHAGDLDADGLEVFGLAKIYKIFEQIGCSVLAFFEEKNAIFAVPKCSLDWILMDVALKHEGLLKNQLIQMLNYRLLVHFEGVSEQIRVKFQMIAAVLFEHVEQFSEGNNVARFIFL